jgi:5-methylcytosine-specific restriction endonuclease McrA
MRHPKRLLAFLHDELDPSTCDACKSQKPNLQIDKRLPRWIGGAYAEGNVHWLCTDCHSQKTRIEVALRMGDLSNQPAWFDLAYPEPTLRSALVWAEENML